MMFHKKSTLMTIPLSEAFVLLVKAVQIVRFSCLIILALSFGFSAKATDEYELARKKVAGFINASDSREIIFTRNATEAINLVAYSWGLSNLKPEDEVCFCCGSPISRLAS